MRDLVKHDALLWLVGFRALIGAFRSLLFHSVTCSLGNPVNYAILFSQVDS